MIEEKDAEIERLSDLLCIAPAYWGARCVFCGEVIGKEKKNQDIADEKSCPKHPLTIARARIWRDLSFWQGMEIHRLKGGFKEDSDG